MILKYDLNMICKGSTWKLNVKIIDYKIHTFALRFAKFAKIIF